MPSGTFLGTIDRTPPPFFRQGPSALTKLFICTALAVFLMVADARFAFIVPLRAALATVLLPVQRALMVPVELAVGGGAYLRGLEEARRDELAAREQATALAAAAHRGDLLAQENAQLRALLALAPTLPARGHAADVLFEARDPYSRKIVIGRGSAQGVRDGSPVLVGDGVLGQVTRVYPLSAEVTLLTDKDAAIPVLNARTRQRLAAFGGAGSGAAPALELRFVALNADIKVGDELVTNGLDGVYPAGLPVARVVGVERPASGGFARVLLEVAANGDGVHQVLVLDPVGLPPAAAAASGPASSAATSASAAPATAPRDVPAGAASAAPVAAAPSTAPVGSRPGAAPATRTPVAPRAAPPRPAAKRPPPAASAAGARR
jgi:rod shape-determining protein MreC